MAKKHEITNGTTFQAVCARGDYYGPYEQNSDDAELDAAGHNGKPGCENHKVKIVKTVTQVNFFVKKK